jgi:hypothetical protein
MSVGFIGSTKKGGEKMKQLRLAVVFALFCGMVSAYGIYSWLSEARAEVAGVTCYTGRFPALVPVK